MFIRKYCRTKIGRAMSIAFLCLMIPLVAINIMLSAQSSRDIQQSLIGSYQNALKLSVDQFSDRLQDLRQLTISLSLDDELKSMSIVRPGDENLFDYVLFHSRLHSYVAQRLLSANISVLLPRQQWVISTEDYIYPMRDVPEIRESMAEAVNCQRWGIRPCGANPDETRLSIVTGYVSDAQSNALFYIELDEQAVLEAISPLKDSSGIVEVFLMDENGELYIGADGGIDAARFAAETDAARRAFFENPTDAGASEFTYTQDRDQFTVLVSKLAGTGCALGVALDSQSVFWPMTMIGYWMLACIAVFCTMMAIYMVITYRHIVAPIDRIHATMEQVGRGDFTAIADERPNNEIGDIATALNRMVEQLKTQIDQRYVYEIQLAQTQLRFLRAQINPHFLYNSLFTLYTFIKNEDLDSAADLAIYLGQYYQINTRADNGDIALYQELEHIRLLVKIQNMRFAGRVQYEEQVDEALKILAIPNLTLLTIAENFLTHGIKNLRGEASLRIMAERRDGEILLTVADTGEGVSAEQLEQMRGALENIDLTQSNLHGLQNVLVRFRMRYGEEVRIEVLSNTPRGLVNVIHIPDKGGALDVQSSAGGR